MPRVRAAVVLREKKRKDATARWQTKRAEEIWIQHRRAKWTKVLAWSKRRRRFSAARLPQEFRDFLTPNLRGYAN